MKKKVYGAIFVLSVLQVLFINLGLYLDLPPAVQIYQYRLWGFHTPWLFFTSRVLQTENEVLIHSDCVLKICQQPGDYRFKALMIQYAIENGRKTQLIQENLCRLSDEKEISYRQGQEEKTVVCAW